MPPSHFTEQFSKDMQSDNKVQWRFDGDKLAKKKYPDRKDVTWDSLNDDEKEAVRADFRGKMRNGTDNPKREGIVDLPISDSEKDLDFQAKLLNIDGDPDDPNDPGNALFDSIFIIA